MKFLWMGVTTLNFATISFDLTNIIRDFVVSSIKYADNCFITDLELLVGVNWVSPPKTIHSP